MPPNQYRLYRLDRAGMIHDAIWFEAEDDADAEAKITARNTDARCEIWHGKRLVASIPRIGLFGGDLSP